MFDVCHKATTRPLMLLSTVFHVLLDFLLMSQNQYLVINAHQEATLTIQQLKHALLVMLDTPALVAALPVSLALQVSIPT